MIQIREAKKGDVEGVLALVMDFSFPANIDEKLFRNAWNEKIIDQNSYIGVAETGNSIIGYVSGYLHYAFYVNGSSFWVDEIYVKEELRRNRVGINLMESISLWIGNGDCKLIALATNGAKEFYNELGFQDSARYFKKYL